MAWDSLDELTPQERAARVTWAIAQGETMSTQQVATLAGMSERGARWLMARLSRVLPVFQDDSGLWRVCETRSASGRASTAPSDTIDHRG